jgi:mannose-6-phosphate isomerase class I
MAIEYCGVTFGATVVRVRNTGTAPLTINQVTFGGEPITILGIYSGHGSLQGDKVALQPGEAVTISMEQWPKAISGNEYVIAVSTASGKSYESSLVWP